MDAVLDDRRTRSARTPIAAAAWRNRSGAGLPWLDVVGAEHAAVEAIQQAGLREVPPDLPEIAARSHARREARRLDRVDRVGDAVDRLELRGERLDVALGERRPTPGSTSRPRCSSISSRIAASVRPTQRSTTSSSAIGQPSVREQLDVEADREALAVDEDPVAVEDDEVEPVRSRGGAGSDGLGRLRRGGRGTPGSGTHSPSDRTSEMRAAIAGSSASAAAIAVSIAVRQRIPSAVAASRISAASRTAPERGVGVLTTRRTPPSAISLEDPDLADRQVRRGAELRDRASRPKPASRRSVRVPGVAASR